MSSCTGQLGRCVEASVSYHQVGGMYRGADKSLARPGRKQATATEDFEFHISLSSDIPVVLEIVRRGR